ncbi:small multi-drug export protein [Natronolimnohabitans sp. A-GB9]|uniref:small multi-drug export protein n=1 Tax=Natronolimnohabitans sp. A-GB9 TaxID=3069757 RepID=UPI0027B46752|nr:small multi-drug export protein [Natronolimnohabitans sp. A-GB9]MDQ2050567.1 small multi-drug export protein [Natronolimnohabitans sp. A-GB9]
MTLTQAALDVGSILEDAGGVLQYALVFVFAAIPIVEILVVVPIAIGLGLDPLVTGLVAFAGNVVSVYALIAAHQRLTTWWRRRRSDADTDSRDRYARARRLWERYGLPGLSFGAPVLTGVHIATLAALLAGSSARLTAGWMTVGIGVWTVLLVVASVFGVSLLGVI